MRVRVQDKSRCPQIDHPHGRFPLRVCVCVCVLTSVFRVCDADVFCDETASAHQTLCSQVETLEIQFFSEVSRDHLDEKECVFMMEVLSVRSLLPHLTSSSYATRPTAGLRWTRVC